MRKKIYLITILIIAIAFTGCNNFINEKPKNFVSANNFYKTKTQMDEAVNGAYSILQSTYGGGSYYWGEERSDNTTFQYNANDAGRYFLEAFDEFAIPSANGASNGGVDNIWSNMYKGIAQCNLILSKVGKSDLSSDQKAKTTGQVEFIRALYYFNLVRLFGGVPLIVKPVTSPDGAFTKGGRATVAAVYKQIISDAQDAANKLPASWSGSDVGRATKGAALTLLGDVYMTQKKWSDAVTTFKKVDNLGYSLMPDYSQLWNPANKNNSESIFEIQYNSGVQGEGSDYMYYNAPFNSGSDLVGFSGVASYQAGRDIPTHDMINAYEKGDKRENASIGWYVNPNNTQYGVALGDTIPYVKKYSSPPTQPGQQNCDFYVYRYAQVLLWEAEALNEEGKTSQAYPYINKVRERAGLNDLTPGMNQSQFRTAVYHEERVENAFEYHRWFQLLRTGRALQVMQKQGQEIKKYYGPMRFNNAYNIQSYQLLLPIPAVDVRLNNLKQNPGWHS